ncbi:MAG: NADH-quinone oxidoreductase subunit C [Dehalococcoidia bacterium]|jgi:NADH:ubiquinone oxidoreductase subunit C|nr:NADH-quinone oxidoreductase subunit C [Dehalococcoidia bacterium]|tara:strand:- start:66 stop:596 length:531 start_codon:yes stop_codon:yes gene_type:complete
MLEKMAEEETTESISEEEVSEDLDPILAERISILENILSTYDISISSFLGEINIHIQKIDLLDILTILKNSPETLCNLFLCLSIVDYEDRFEAVYHLQSTTLNHRYVIKSSLDKDKPLISSCIGIWKGCDWYEREGHDLFGVVFEGHPNLSPLLLYEEFEGYPGRKDFPFNDYKEW